MKAFDEYAYILNNEVKNIGVFTINQASYSLANTIAKACYGDSAIAVNVSQCPVQAGDIYRGNKFYRDNVEIAFLPTDEQQIASLINQLETQSNDIDSLIISLTPEVQNV